jgi:DNA-directed RNA polymerase subunit K/omega
MHSKLPMVPLVVTSDDVREPPGLAPAKVTGWGPGRFLFIDVAAMRARQLRAGARPRITTEALVSHKLEWVAMEEVRRGLVSYELPSQTGESAASLQSTSQREWSETSNAPKM